MACDGVTATRGRSAAVSKRGRPPLVGGLAGCFFSVVIDESRQVPAPSAPAWLFDLSERRGPSFAVLRRHEDEARVALGLHLADSGAVVDLEDAIELLDGVNPHSVTVVW